MKTFKGIRAEAQRTYKEIAARWEAKEKQLAQMKNAGYYSDQYLLNQQREADQEFRKACGVAAAELSALVKKTVAGKRQVMGQINHDGVETLNRAEAYLNQRINELKNFTGWETASPLFHLFFSDQLSDSNYDPVADRLDRTEPPEYHPNISTVGRVLIPAT